MASFWRYCCLFVRLNSGRIGWHCYFFVCSTTEQEMDQHTRESLLRLFSCFLGSHEKNNNSTFPCSPRPTRPPRLCSGTSPPTAYGLPPLVPQFACSPDHFHNAHGVSGLILTVFVMLQVVAAVFRPHVPPKGATVRDANGEVVRHESAKGGAGGI